MQISRSILIQAAIWAGILSFFLFTGSMENKPDIFYKITTVRIAMLAVLYNVVNRLVMPLYIRGQKRLFYFWISVVFSGFLAIGIGIDILMHSEMFMPQNQPVKPYYKVPNKWQMRIIPNLVLGLTALAVAAMLSSFSAFEKKKKSEEEANSRRIEAELALLKSQINPHFLLNTLNNLYAMAVTAPDKTPDALLKLSEMVRFILYECDQPRIPLDKELDFVSNYIDLQKLRLPPNVTVDFNLPTRPVQGHIEPMLLIPFVENAFKHGLTTKVACKISVRILYHNHQLVLEVENPVLDKKQDKNGNISGIGVANTRQRLERGYPGRHTLDISHDEYLHRVKLILQIVE